MLTNLIVALLGALGVGLVVSALLSPARQKTEERGLEAGLPGGKQPDEDRRKPPLPPLLDRLVGPVVGDLVSFMGRNPARREDLERRLRRSGWRYQGAEDFYANKVLAAGLFFMIGAAAVAVVGKPGLFFLPLLLGTLGLYIPDRELAEALKRRRRALYVEMAFTLDRLAVLMKAGLAFSQALKDLVTAESGGIFMTALRAAVARTALGARESESLQEMLDDLPEEPELEKFVQRAKKTGRLADALLAQADLMRNRVESDLLAQGLRSTLVITTIGGAFILPALALLVVGPPIVLALRIFSF